MEVRQDTESTYITIIIIHTFTSAYSNELSVVTAWGRKMEGQAQDVNRTKPPVWSLFYNDFFEGKIKIFPDTDFHLGS